MVESLKRARKAKGLSLAEVAAAAGLLPEAVARAERDDTDPRFSTIVAIAGALDVPVCELVKEKSHAGHRRPQRKA